METVLNGFGLTRPSWHPAEASVNETKRGKRCVFVFRQSRHLTKNPGEILSPKLTGRTSNKVVDLAPVPRAIVAFTQGALARWPLHQLSGWTNLTFRIIRSDYR